MRIAAEQAGIGGAKAAISSRISADAAPSRLALALEPEAAAISAIPSVRTCILLDRITNFRFR